MKKLLMMLLIAGVSTSAFAQTSRVYKGAVIDKNGNLMPGVRVQATKGTEETVTDADGSFSLEAPITLKSVTATYPGMSKSKKSVKKNPDEVVIEMDTHQQSQWFAGVVGGYSFEDYEVTSLGVMGGKKGFWGYYAKFVLDITKPKGRDGDDTDSGKGFTFTMGGIKSITRNFYIYFGGGYNLGYDRKYNYDGNRSYRKWKNESGIAADFGFMYTVVDMINITAGATGRFTFDGKSAPGILFGASYCF